MRKGKPKTIHRFELSETDATSLTDVLEWTEDKVRLSRSCRCDRYTFIGVPGRLVDVIVDERLPEHVLGPRDERDWIALETCMKPGRYDGAVRMRLCIRIRRKSDGVDSTPTRLGIDSTERALTLTFGGETFVFPRLRSDLSEYKPRRLVAWHKERYFKHLSWEEIDSAYQEWEMLEFLPNKGHWTLAEANRSASRFLYRLSRDIGWSKLTIRERDKLRLDSPSPWIRTEAVERARARRRGLSGVGEATLRAASSNPTTGFG